MRKRETHRWGYTDVDGNVVRYAIEGIYQYRLFKWPKNSGWRPWDGFALAAGDEVRYVHLP